MAIQPVSKRFQVARWCTARPFLEKRRRYLQAGEMFWDTYVAGNIPNGTHGDSLGENYFGYTKKDRCSDTLFVGIVMSEIKLYCPRKTCNES
jgi:hypothetical protein